MKSSRTKFPGFTLRATWPQRGFTLIELLVVIAIIGLLSTLAIVALGSARQKSRDARRLADLKQIQTAMEMHNSATGGYPVISSTILLGDTNHACLGSNGFQPAGACTDQYISFAKDPSGGNYTYTGNSTDYQVLAVLEGSVNDLSGAVAAQPNAGILNSYNSAYGLVGWWKLDEGSGQTAYDSSGMQRTATLVTGAAFGPGKIGTGLVTVNTQGARASFDGGILKPGNETSSFTLSIWVNLASVPTNNESILLGRQGCNGGIIASSAQVFRFQLAASDCWTSGAFLDSGAILNFTGNWHLVTVTYLNRTMKIYVDGDLKNTRQFSGSSLYGYNNELGIGGVGTYQIAGTVDDARIYNRALSDVEIKSLYDSQK